MVAHAGEPAVPPAPPPLQTLRSSPDPCRTMSHSSSVGAARCRAFHPIRATGCRAVRPIGATGCSHGWSDGAAKPADAKPVESRQFNRPALKGRRNVLWRRGERGPPRHRVHSFTFGCQSNPQAKHCCALGVRQSVPHFAHACSIFLSGFSRSTRSAAKCITRAMPSSSILCMSFGYMACTSGTPKNSRELLPAGSDDTTCFKRPILTRSAANSSFVSNSEKYR